MTHCPTLRAPWTPALCAGVFGLSAIFAQPLLADGHSVLAQKISDALDHHVRLCSVALANPDGFYHYIAATVPEGSYALATSPDGRVNRLAMVAEGGLYNTHLSQYTYAGSRHINCVTYVADYDGLLPVEDVATAYVEVITAHVGTDAVAGGLTPSYFANETSGGLIVDNSSYEFLVDGLLEGLPVRTITAVHEGYVSFVTELLDAP